MWQEQYLTRSLRSLRVEHSKIKFISTRGHVVSSIYDQINDRSGWHQNRRLWEKIGAQCVLGSYAYQEKAEIQLEFQDEPSVDEVFNEQVPSELAANSQTTENHGPSAITMYNQPTEISDDQLRKSVRSLNKMQRKAYNRVLSWTRNKMKNL